MIMSVRTAPLAKADFAVQVRFRPGRDIRPDVSNGTSVPEADLGVRSKLMWSAKSPIGWIRRAAPRRGPGTALHRAASTNQGIGLMAVTPARGNDQNFSAYTD